MHFWLYENGKIGKISRNGKIGKIRLYENEKIGKQEQQQMQFLHCQDLPDWEWNP